MGAAKARPSAQGNMQSTRQGCGTPQILLAKQARYLSRPEQGRSTARAKHICCNANAPPIARQLALLLFALLFGSIALILGQVTKTWPH